MALLYFCISVGIMKMGDIMMDVHRWLKMQLVWITVLIIIAIGSSCLGTPLSVFVQYKHSYFISYQNVSPDTWRTATVWEPGEETAWPRWTFLYQIDQKGIQWTPHANMSPNVNMSITTTVPIDLSIWHKPPVTVRFPTYTWHEVPCASDLTFTMDVHTTVNPGARFERRTEPEVVPPGVSDVCIKTNVTVTSQPTVNEIGVFPYSGFIQVFCNAWRSKWLEILAAKVDWAKSSPAWGPLVINPDWANRNGFYIRTRFGGVPVGESFPLVLHIQVRNRANEPLHVRPVVELNWLFKSVEQSGPVIEGRMGNRVEFKIHGPNGETLDTAIYSTTGEPLNVSCKPVDIDGYHGAIWIYWPQVIEPASNLND